jgi:hypothetical protein
VSPTLPTLAVEFSALVTLSVVGWHAAVTVSRLAPTLQALVINRDETELGPRSSIAEMQLRQAYWFGRHRTGTL